MGWIKIPAENHPLFMDALPKDPRISTLKMFGGLAGKVNGHMFSGLFAHSAMVKLSEADQKEALALDGSAPFDPMGNGRLMKDTILLAEEVMDDPQVLREWLRRSFEYGLTLPKKAEKPAAVAAKPAANAAKPAAKKPVVAKKKPAAAKKKPAAAKKKPAAAKKKLAAAKKPAKPKR